MTRRFPSSLVAAFVALATAATGCAPSAEEVADDSESDLTLGSRWRSPLEVGDYDSDDVTMHVYTWADRQGASITGSPSYGSPTFDCAGTVSVVEGKAHIDGRTYDDEHCEVDLVPTREGGIKVHSTGAPGLDAVLLPRRANALVGIYESRSGAAIEVTSSGDGKLTLGASLNGRPLVSDATATLQGTDFVTGVFFSDYRFDKGPLEGCQMHIHRSDGMFQLIVNYVLEYGDGACPIRGVALPR